MDWMQSMQRAIDYMEQQLLEPLTVEQIARQAHVSPYHFQRMFLILTNISVGEYVRRRRLTLAAQELSVSDIRIIDAAFKYGYESPEAFAKAFRKQHGMAPSEARKGGLLQAYNRLHIQVQLKGAEPMNYRIVERSAFSVVGIKQECVCGNQGADGNAIAAMWQEAASSGVLERLGGMMNGEIKGVLGLTDNYNAEANTIDYWIAVEHEGAAADLDSIDIPASKWAVFDIKGPGPVAMPEAWGKIYVEWIPSNGYEIGDIPAIEAYTDPNPYREDSLNQIWLAVK